MEARALAAAGTKELILIAQDTSMYGRDRGARRGGLARLLEQLNAIDGLEWIRLLYLYPATVDSELIDAMGVAREGLRVHGHAVAARASGRVARDAPSVQRRTLPRDHR